LDPAWIVADYTDPGAPLPAGIDPARVAAARHALSCGPLAELQSSVRAPLTPSRFLHNLLGAWTRTGFRYPDDPVAAEHALCRH
jgi:arabinofuranosyltransferase